MTALHARLARLEGRRSTSGTDIIQRDSADFDSRIEALAARADTDCEDISCEEIARREAAFDTAFAALGVA